MSIKTLTVTCPISVNVPSPTIPASDGSTPKGTAVCYIPENLAGTIMGWNGVNYLVYILSLGINSYMRPTDLKLGDC